MKKINSDTFVGIGFAFLSIVFLIMTHSMEKESGPGPDLFPKIVAGAMLVVSVVLIVRSLISGAEKKVEINKTGFLHVIITIAITIIYVIILPKVGFLLSSIALFIPTLILFGVKRKSYITILGVCIPVLIYGIFKFALNVPLP